MKENELQHNDEFEINFGKIIDAVWKKAWLILVSSLICAVITLLGTLLFITPKYQSSAMFYVNNSDLSVGDTSLSLSTGDISAAKSLVDSYIVILQTRTTLNDVIDYADVDRTYSEIKDMIEAVSVNGTEIFRVTVTSPDPHEAEKIANAIAYILPKRISGIVEGTSAKIVDSAIVAGSPSSPSYTVNTLVGFLLGAMLSVCAIVLLELFDISIRDEDDIAQVCKHPVLTLVPDMTSPSKGGYYSKTAQARGKKGAQEKKQNGLVGDQINFAASEAYKLLRTKIQYSFAGDKNCRVIGVSSALTGEGKSVTAVNLAHTLSQLGSKVLLIDCDMRRPSLPVKLPIQKKPGLSGFLSGQEQQSKLLQYCGIPGDEHAFHVIASGQNPPNPVELLSSVRMHKMLEKLSENYDYIILDLPPIGEVSDALAVAKETDGILLVVRQDYCYRLALHSAIRQFEFVDARILGVVFNATSEEVSGYGKKYNRKYYRKYYNQSAQREKV